MPFTSAQVEGLAKSKTGRTRFDQVLEHEALPFERGLIAFLNIHPIETGILCGIGQQAENALNRAGQAAAKRPIAAKPSVFPTRLFVVVRVFGDENGSTPPGDLTLAKDRGHWAL